MILFSPVLQKLQKMKIKIEAIVNEIISGERFLIASHLNPDGDAIGSSLALALALEKMGKEVVVYNRDPLPYQFGFLSSSERIVNSLEDEAAFDATFVVDCSEPERVGEQFSQMVSTKKWINVDHHLTNEYFADISFIDKDACSTGYLVYQILKELPVELTKDIAENIYTTILVDTGSFRYSNANNDAFKVAGEMVALGVSPWDVANKIYENQPQARIELLTAVLNTLKVEDGGEIASVVVTRDMMEKSGTGPDATDGFVNYPRSIEGVEVAFLVREVGEDLYKISFRSKGNINVAQVSQSFGGGGHRNAAGCVIKGSLTDVRISTANAVAKVLDIQ